MLFGLGIACQALWLPAKAQLAQYLIASAWAVGSPQRPWPWADIQVISRLQVPELGLDQYVLSGGQGNALAFGPTQTPGQLGPRVLAGHRDTHFRFLEDLRPGHVLQLTDVGEPAQYYRVTAAEILDSRTQTPDLHNEQLLLITCYPFDAVQAGGPLRYVVYAQLQENTSIL